jgi:hypothetical protein
MHDGYHCERNVGQNDGGDAATECRSEGQGAEVAGEQHNVSRLHRNRRRRAAPTRARHRYADVRSGERRGVVDAIAYG